MPQSIRNAQRTLRLTSIAMWAMVLCGMGSCIDEDLSDCQQEYSLTYSLQLHSDITLELTDKLTLDEEQDVSRRLKEVLRQAFADVASDIDLRFYKGDDCTHHEHHNVRTNAQTLGIRIAPGTYQNVAIADAVTEPAIDITTGPATETRNSGISLGSLALATHKKDTLATQSTAIFAANKAVTLNQSCTTAHITLHTINASPILVIDTHGIPCQQIEAYVVGVADCITLADSTYHLTRSHHTRPQRIDAAKNRTAFLAVTLPTPPSQPTWQYHAYITIDGHTTQNIISSTTPLMPGTAQVLTCSLRPDGTLVTTLPDVAIAVKLDWTPGNNYDLIM